MMKFTIDDIKDKERLDKMVEKEANAIYSSPVARKGRTMEDVKFAVKQGKVAELYLIENMGYQEADIKFHDLKDPNTGEYYEVKSYSVSNRNAPFVEKDLKRLKNESWCKSKWYLLFNFYCGQYEFIEKIQIK